MRNVRMMGSRRSLAFGTALFCGAALFTSGSLFASSGLAREVSERDAPARDGLAQEGQQPGPQPRSAAPQESDPSPSAHILPAQAVTTPDSTLPTPDAPQKLIVPSGTRLPLVLHNAVTTRNAKPGDPVYLETLFPIVIKNRILIPAGTYVQGEILEAKRPGKIKGQGEMRMRLTSMILPNGYSVDFNAVPTNTGTGGNESADNEGNVRGDTDKAGDAGTIAKGAGVGAGIGAIAGRSAAGAGAGAGIGAAVGLATVLLTRGPELELPRGTTIDIVLDRSLYLDASRITFTDPGRASTLAGPPNREPTRSRSPL